MTSPALHFVKGLEEGIVSSISGLEVGNNLRISFYPLDHQTYKQSDALSYAQSTRIVSIE